MQNIKGINIKNRTYYFFNDMVNIKDFDSNLLKTDIKSYKNIDIYYIGYNTMKDLDYVNIYCVNPWYFITDKIDGFIEENDGNEYLTLVCKERMEEIDTITCLKKINKNLKNAKKIIVKQRDQYKKFLSLFLCIIWKWNKYSWFLVTLSTIVY